MGNLKQQVISRAQQATVPICDCYTWIESVLLHTLHLVLRNSVLVLCHKSLAYWAAGQGVNQALEDAVELALAVQEGGLGQDSLREYEAKRILRVREVMAAAMASSLPVPA